MGTLNASLILPCVVNGGRSGWFWVFYFGGNAEPDIVTLSALINGKISQAVSLFDEMVGKGYLPHLIVYSTVLNGLCKIGSTDKDVKFLSIGRGFLPNIVACSTVIDCLCKHGLIKEALDLFSELKVKDIKPNIVTYSCLINGMCNSGIEPNVVTYSLLIDARCKEEMVSKAEDTVGTMIQRGIEPDVFTYSALIDGHCLQNKVDKARRVFQLMIEKGCAPDIVCYNTIINGYCKVKRLDEAMELFHEIS